MMPRELKALLRGIAQQITPRTDERKQVTRLLATVQSELQQHFDAAGIDCDVQIHGSIARDTWLRTKAEIDVFLVMPPPSHTRAIPQALDLVKTYLGPIWQEAYADHPYLQATIQGVKIDFVPCYQITTNDALISAVDRSPLHTQLITTRLHNDQKRDVRLLKQFMHGTGLYGAEIKIGGFSGYLCELLILHYGTFLTTLHKVVSWQIGEMIDIDEQWHGRQRDAQQQFKAALIVIDPVDAQRNVASAVTVRRMGELITAAQRFLQNPAKTYFFPTTENITLPEMERYLQNLQFEVIAISFTCEAPAPDILWGQLHRTRRAIAKQLHRRDFSVFTSDAWSDEQENHILVFSLASMGLPLTKNQQGPPTNSPDAPSFLTKHLQAPSTRLGPWIDGTRWCVVKIREYSNAYAFLTEQLTKDGGQAMGVARGFIKPLQQQHTISVNQEILALGLTHPPFLRFFHTFLRGRPQWLQ
jgi:tRNA nucleotidyltransferase (CCA-adding enzyme)